MNGLSVKKIYCYKVIIKDKGESEEDGIDCRPQFRSDGEEGRMIAKGLCQAACVLIKALLGLILGQIY